MVILTASQIREWDLFTIEQEPIASIDLMEAAALRGFQWLQQRGMTPGTFQIFCGKGNNGGDGLAVARMLSRQGSQVSVYILELGQAGTPDFQANLARLHETDSSIHYIQSKDLFPPLSREATLIDALFGTGLNRPLTGLAADLVGYLNGGQQTRISLDIPSGLFSDDSSLGNPVIKATHTLSFQCLKFAFLMAENEPYFGMVHVLDIGLLRNYLSQISYGALLLEPDRIREIYRPRRAFAHKGNFGHAALIAGSYGMMGAVVLASKACLRAGVGKLTCHVPACGYEIMQTAVPEAMVKVEPGEDHLGSIGDISRYQAIGMGPGMGIHPGHAKLLDSVFRSYSGPLVLDADALNCIGKFRELLLKIPKNSILTPPPCGIRQAVRTLWK
jgi:ADP-dependent NAD(P)H-hydrate dehydratase / NAD(P)H-hydrate epimerase